MLTLRKRDCPCWALFERFIFVHCGVGCVGWEREVGKRKGRSKEKIRRIKGPAPSNWVFSGA
jgi:hypothetical protein